MNSWECPFVIIFLWHNIRVGSSTVLGDFTTVYASSHVDKATILPPCVRTPLERRNNQQRV